MTGVQPILIASDHAGLQLKAELIRRLPDWSWIDVGPHSHESVDYPDYAELLGHRLITSGEATSGILICGSGIGMSIAANKIKGIRAAVVENPISARLAREHNNANILCLGSRFVAPEYGADIVKAWLDSTFDAESRHTRRIEKIQKLEKK